MKSIIRVAVADDHQLFRSGLKTILATHPYIEVVLEATNGQELIDGLSDSEPDVVLLDLEMPVLSGKETLQYIRKVNEAVKVLVLTMHQSKAMIAQVMELGANGYLVKDCEPSDVIEAIESLTEKGYYFSDQIAMAMLNQLTGSLTKGASAQDEHGLSIREIDILKLICKEYTTNEIGEALYLSPKTIEGYRKALMEKSKARNMAGLVLFAVKHNLVEGV